eukprot:1142461-Pelagomonas_calceolata.AAC.2
MAGNSNWKLLVALAGSDPPPKHLLSPLLDSLGDRLLSLDIPCISSITDALYVTSFYLPLLQHLVLHLEWEWQESQLTTLVLSVPPGSSPFKFCEQPTNNHLLDLSPYPALRHLVLRGPIVKQGSFESNGGQPFILPFHAKVSRPVNPTQGVLHNAPEFGMHVRFTSRAASSLTRLKAVCICCPCGLLPDRPPWILYPVDHQ